MYEPAIKWSGSKRSQAKEIIKYFPDKIDTYYEPFCGGCSVLRRLLDSDILVKKYVCSDINSDLINLWNKIKDNPSGLIESYKEHWNLLNMDDNKDRKRKYFESVRYQYNKTHKEEDFLFIMRTTTNGMPRYNKKGEFNNSFHITRDGIKPDTLAKIITDWSCILNQNEVEFICRDYKEIKTKENDLLYLDPPYAGTKGMYYGGIELNELFNWLREQTCYYVLSFDGTSGHHNNTFDMPTDIYSQHLYLRSGNSSFKRVIGNSNDSIVYESLYIK